MIALQDSLLGDFLTVEHGFAFKGEYFSDSGKYIVLTPGNFYEEGGFKLRPNKDRYYFGEIPVRYILKRKDLIVAMTEQAEGLLGCPAFIPESNRYLHNQRLGLVLPKSNVADKSFLYFLFNTFLVRQQIRNSSSGTKVRHTSPERIYGVKVRMPPLHIQKKIAAILATYDDLIENNKRRIALLEKMAEEIYREWFVRFRFPGYEKVTFEKRVPVGWRTGKISDTASFRYGFTESALENSKLPKYLRVTDINKSSFINWAKVPNCQIDEIQFEKYMLKKGDIVIARMADPGKVAIIEENIKGVFASYLIKIEYDPKKVKPYFLFYTLSSKYYLGLFSGADSGSTRSSINAGAIGNTYFVYPDIELMRLFDKTISALREQIVNLNKACNKLERNKSMLLPRLISGKLSVEDLDIQFPPSMLEETEPEPQETADG